VTKAVAAAGFRLDVDSPATLAVAGELGFDTAKDALQAMQSALVADVRISRLDLAGVTRSDSAGLACVLAVVADVRGRGRSLEVANMPAGMRALAQVCEVDRMMG
jgi:phospholipid transport system transporter-binding protein